jgi:ketosteroid isomerase-like protein
MNQHQIVRAFFASLESAVFAEGMFTADATFWTMTSGSIEKARFFGGVRMLQSIFLSGLRYSIDTLTVEEDRAVAEASSQGVLVDGAAFQNVHVFTFRFADGRIAAVKEYMNPDPVSAKLAPLMQAAMAKKP